MDATASKCAAEYEFSSTQLNLPPELARAVRAMARSIAPEDLVRIEYVPHTTLLYGIHTKDPQPIRTLLADESPIRIRFGKTEMFTPSSESGHGSHGDADVVFIKILSPDMRRINQKLRNGLAHTMTYPKYSPHVTVAYVKKGRGHKYVGRTDLEGKTWVGDTVRFSRPSGKKTIISLTKTAGDYKQMLDTAPAWMAIGGLGAAGLGRYLAAPLLSRLFRLDPKRARRIFTALGLGVGALPGAMLGAIRSKTHGSFFAPDAPPRDLPSLARHLGWTMGSGSYSPRRGVEARPETRVDASRFYDAAPTLQDYAELNKSSSDNPLTWSRTLWEPNFPVATAMDDVTRNPLIPVSQKSQMRQLIAQAGREQGVGDTGTASPGALIQALPKVVSNAVPTVGGAWLASKALGASPRVKNTAIGAAMVYSTLKGFMNKGAAAQAPERRSEWLKATLARLRKAKLTPKAPNVKVNQGTLRSAPTIAPTARALGKRAGVRLNSLSPNPLIGKPDPDNQGVGNWYARAINTAMKTPFADFGMTIPMRDHQWDAAHKRAIVAMERKRRGNRIP